MTTEDFKNLEALLLRSQKSDDFKLIKAYFDLMVNAIGNKYSISIHMNDDNFVVRILESNILFQNEDNSIQNAFNVLQKQLK